MRSLALSKVYQVLEPGPVVLLATMRNGRPNVMTMSWHMMIEFEPPKIACIVSENNYSFAALKLTRECVIGVPSVALAAKVVKIGNCHGDRVDKFKSFGLAPLPAQRIGAPIIGECHTNLECRVVDTAMVRKYNLFILEVVKAWQNPSLRNRKTIHHKGYGKFVVDGREIQLKSRMR